MHDKPERKGEANAFDQGLEEGVWISSHGLNFRTFTNHVTFFSDFTNLMKLTSGFALRPLLLAIS